MIGKTCDELFASVQTIVWEILKKVKKVIALTSLRYFGMIFLPCLLSYDLMNLCMTSAFENSLKVVLTSSVFSSAVESLWFFYSSSSFGSSTSASPLLQ